MSRFFVRAYSLERFHQAHVKGVEYHSIVLFSLPPSQDPLKGGYAL